MKERPFAAEDSIIYNDYMFNRDFVKKDEELDGKIKNLVSSKVNQRRSTSPELFVNNEKPRRDSDELDPSNIADDAASVGTLALSWI